MTAEDAKWYSSAEHRESFCGGDFSTSYTMMLQLKHVLSHCCRGTRGIGISKDGHTAHYGPPTQAIITFLSKILMERFGSTPSRSSNIICYLQPCRAVPCCEAKVFVSFGIHYTQYIREECRAAIAAWLESLTNIRKISVRVLVRPTSKYIENFLIAIAPRRQGMSSTPSILRI